MCRDCLRLTRPLQHEQLWKYCDTLEENGEGPHYFGERETIVEDEGKEGAGAEEVFNAECVDRGVVRWSVEMEMSERMGMAEKGSDGPEFSFHEVENVHATRDEEYLH